MNAGGGAGDHGRRGGERPAGRSGPRKLGGALDRVVAVQAPQTLLAEVQSAWPRACGAAIAARSEPVAELAGTVTIACESGPWAQELELMSDVLRLRIEHLVGEGRVQSIRFTADLSRHR